MGKGIVSNLKLNIIFTVITGFLSFFVNRSFAENLGLETLGLMRLFSQLLAYLSLVEMGLGTASAFSLYKPLAVSDYKTINIRISTMDHFYKRISLVILTAGLGLNLLLPYFVEGTDAGTYIYWSLYVVNTSIGYTFVKYHILFVADQRYGFVKKTGGMLQVGCQLLQVISLIYLKSFVVFIFIMIVSNLLKLYYYREYCQRNYPFIRRVKDRDEKILEDTKNLFWHSLAGLVVHNTDYIILSKFTSLSVVGIYSTYLVICKMVRKVPQLINPAIKPRIGKFIAVSSDMEIYSLWQELNVFYIYMGTILITATYFLVDTFVELWMGREFLLPRITVILILINLFVNLTKGITLIFKNQSGFFDDIHLPILESIINLVLSLGLVHRMGLNGVIIGTVASNLIVIVFLKPFMVFKRVFKKDGREYFKVFTVNCTMVLLSGFSSYYIIDKTLRWKQVEGWTSWLTLAVLVTLTGILTSTLVFTMSRDFRRFIVRALEVIRERR